jgi:hypothetical protein
MSIPNVTASWLRVPTAPRMLNGAISELYMGDIPVYIPACLIYYDDVVIVASSILLQNGTPLFCLLFS